jgi:hypothetical protein
MDMTDEGIKIRRTVHLSEEAWELARVAALREGARREEAVSRSAWIEEAIVAAGRAKR